MPNVVFFSFSDTDREEVLLVKGRAVNGSYAGVNFRVQDLLKRWVTEDPAVIRQAISKSIGGTSRTIVFVGNDTWGSRWAPEEVQMTIGENKPVYAIRVRGTFEYIPSCLSRNGIQFHGWSEPTLQRLADRCD